jgi:hypothetical protein
MTEYPGGQHPRHEAQGLLPARSATEAQLYLNLNPCACDTARPRDTQELRGDGRGGLTSVRAGTCAGCGCPWSVEFSLPASPPPPGHIGGSEPSKIIDPGEWLLLSDQDADIEASSAPDQQVRARLARAAAEIDEVLKFIPVGADCVPDDAFTTSRGRAMLDVFPDRFRKPELVARAQLYRTGAGLGSTAARTRTVGRHPRPRRRARR